MRTLTAIFHGFLAAGVRLIRVTGYGLRYGNRSILIHPSVELRNCRFSTNNSIGESARLNDVTLGPESAVGDDCRLVHTTTGSWNRIARNCHLSQVVIGEYSYIGENTWLADTTIGRFCSIGPGLIAGRGMHPSRGFVSTHPAFFSTQR